MSVADDIVAAIYRHGSSEYASFLAGPGSAKSARGGAGGEVQPLALHWVRGHFKSFTDAKPLFGRITGTFWWEPHLAGDIEAGAVVKDYAIDADGYEPDGGAQ